MVPTVIYIYLWNILNNNCNIQQLYSCIGFFSQLIVLIIFILLIIFSSLSFSFDVKAFDVLVLSFMALRFSDQIHVNLINPLLIFCLNNVWLQVMSTYPTNMNQVVWFDVIFKSHMSISPSFNVVLKV